MTILSTDIATQVYPNRYYVDTSELFECVNLPISPFAVDKLTPEGAFRPLSVLMYVNVGSPVTPNNRVILAYFDKILPGYLIDVTDFVRAYIVDPLTPASIALGFSIVINVNEVLYEIPTKAAIVKQSVPDDIVNVDFIDMVAITDPDPLSFVIETTPFLVKTYHTTSGILIPNVANDGGVFRLRRVINPVFSGSTIVPANIIVVDISTDHPTGGFTLFMNGGNWSFGIKTSPDLDIQILDVTAPGNTLISVIPFTVNGHTTQIVNFNGYSSATVTITHTGLNTPFVFEVVLFP